jgi:hypothetical protein
MKRVYDRLLVTQNLGNKSLVNTRTWDSRGYQFQLIYPEDCENAEPSIYTLHPHNFFFEINLL